MRAARAKKGRFPESWAPPAAAGKWRSCVLSFGETLERGNLMPRGKILQAFGGGGAMPEIGLEPPFDSRRRFLCFHVAQNLAPDRGRDARAPAGDDVIAVHRIAFLVDANPRGDEPDVADVMLRAGMMAAGQVDIDRLIESYPSLAPIRDGLGVGFGVGGRKPAAGRAGAGYEPGPDRRCPPFEAGLFRRRFGPFQAPFRNSRDQQVLPDS